jgi:hypothetical protein
MTEHNLAVDLIKCLDGVSIETARGALAEAMVLLSSTQIVSATSPLLISESRYAEAPSGSRPKAFRNKSFGPTASRSFHPKIRLVTPSKPE